MTMITAMDSRELRKAMGNFMTGVTVVTTRMPDGTRRGFTANSFTSVSLGPPLVLVCLAKTAESYDCFCEAEVYAINILGAGQRESAMRFASKSPDKFDGTAFHDGLNGAPLLDGSICWFECRRHELIDAGDHVILIGRVIDYGTREDRPLGYFRGSFLALTEEAEQSLVRADTGALVECIATHEDKVLLVRKQGASRWSLPHHAMGTGGQGGPQAELVQVLRRADSGLSLSFLYSVFEHEPENRLHVIYRGALDNKPRPDGVKGYDLQMFGQAEVPWDEVDDFLCGAVLRRYFDEMSKARFGVYSRLDRKGHVELLHLADDEAARVNHSGKD